MRQALATVLALFALLTGSWVIAPVAHADVPVTTVAVSASSFRPAPDGIEDSVTISATVDPAATSVTITVDPGVASWTLTPDPGSHQVSQVWNGQGSGGTDGLASAGTHTITAVAHTPSGDVTGETTVTVLIDTISATRDLVLTAKPGLAKNLSGRCGKLQMPSAHHWRDSIGFNADARCAKHGKTYAEGVFAVRFLGTFEGHTVHAYTTIQVSAYGAAAPKAYRRSTGLLVLRGADGRFLQPAKLSANQGWHAGHTVPAIDVLYPDNSFAWDLVSLDHAHYDVKAFKITVGYTYLY